MRERYTRKQKLIIYAVCTVGMAIIFTFTFYDSNKRGASLLAHEGFTTGVITQIQHGRGTAFMNIYIQYNLTMQGKNIAYSQYTNWNATWDSLIGKSFPVIYDTTEPHQFYILIFPDDFKYNKLSFPDSLKWVLKYKE